MTLPPPRAVAPENICVGCSTVDPVRACETCAERRGREAERAEIVEWLRGQPMTVWNVHGFHKAKRLAEGIERLEHKDPV